MLKSFTCFYHAYIFRCRVQLFFVGKKTFCVNLFGRINSKGFFHLSFVLFEIWSEHSGARILLRECLDVELKLNLPPPLVTLLAEPFLTVHMLCTEKRLCTNPVKFLLSMLSALLSNSFEPRANRCSFLTVSFNLVPRVYSAFKMAAERRPWHTPL